MSPKRGERVAPPARSGQYALRFATAEAAKGWEDLCQQVPANTRAAFDAMERNPKPIATTSRHHRLKGPLAWQTFRGRSLAQWQYEVSGGGRILYLIDDETRTCWIHYAGTGHPKLTE